MKNFCKRFLCMLLVSLFVCMPVFATNYGKKFQFSLSVNDKSQISVVVGSEFTVRLKLSRTDSKASGKYTMYVAEDYIMYDTDYVTPMLSMIDMMDSGFKLVKQDISDGDYEKFRIRRKNPDGELVSDEMVVFDLTFKANKVGRTTIKNDDYGVSTEDTREFYSSYSNNLTINIVASEDKKSDTIDTSSSTSFYVDAKGDVANDGEMEAYFSDADIKRMEEKSEASLDLVLTAKNNGTTEVKNVLLELKNSIISTVAAMNRRITLNTPIAEIKFNNTWLRSMTGKFTSAKNNTIFQIATLSKDQLNADQSSKIDDTAKIYKIDTIINNIPCSIEQGSADVTVKYELSRNRDEEYITVYQLNNDGVFYKIPCTYNSKMKTLTFTISQNGFYAIVLDELNKFTDISKGDWCYDSVKFVSNKKLFNGVSDTMFDPNSSMTRAMMVTTLYRLAGEPRVYSESVTFADVAQDAWYANAINWACSKGLISGYNETTFAPDERINREQIASVLMNYINMRTSRFSVDENMTLSFSDTDEISPEMTTAIKFCVSNGILSGRSNGKFAPKSYVTRAEVATILMRLYEKL